MAATFESQKEYIKGVIANLKAMKKMVSIIKDPNPKSADNKEIRRWFIMSEFDKNLELNDKSFKDNVRVYIEDAMIGRFASANGMGQPFLMDLSAVQGSQRGQTLGRLKTRADLIMFIWEFVVKTFKSSFADKKCPCCGRP
jgi:hypothetical protein